MRPKEPIGTIEMNELVKQPWTYERGMEYAARMCDSLPARFSLECRIPAGVMVEDLRSMIPLLTISRGGTTVRLAAWPESIRSHGEQYAPCRCMFVWDSGDGSTTWKRVEIMLDHAVMFPAPFPGEGPIDAMVQFVTERNREDIIERFDGVLTLHDDKIYIEPVRLVPPA